MLISTALFPPACWTAGSLPSLWLFNVGPSQAQTSWRRGFSLISQETPLLRHILFTRSTTQPFPKNAGRPARLQDLSKAPEFLLSKKKNSREQRGWDGEEWRGERGKKFENEEGIKQSTRPQDLFFYLFCTDYERSASARYNMRWGGGGPEYLRMAPRIRLQENKGRWDGGGWRRLCLFYTNPLNQDEMKARGDGWRRMMRWRVEKESRGVGVRMGHSQYNC